MKRKNLAFTVELLGLFILLLLVITVITRVFVMSRAHSLEARQLTEAVILAESTAEISSSELHMNDLASRIADMKNCMSSSFSSTENDPVEGRILFTAVFNVTSGDYADNADYVISLDRHCDQNGKGTYAEDVINIYSAEEVNEAASALDKKGYEREDPLGSSSDEGMPAPIYTLTAGKYFGEDQ